MSTSSIYVLDTSVFTTAARFYYAFDIVPEFWERLEEEASKGRIISIDRVRDEILRGSDKLAEWVRDNFQNYFVNTKNDLKVLAAYREVIVWARQQTQYLEAAKSEFAQADKADAWLVAYARAKGHNLVTQEKFDPNRRNKIPIPNACRAFGVTCVDTYEMLRQLRIKIGSK